VEALATFGWRKDVAVADGLFADGHRFDFYQAVKVLEILSPLGEGPGEGVDPALAKVLFRSKVDLQFAPGEIERIAPAADGLPPVMTVRFLGLAGAGGPLPQAFTELVLARVAKGDLALRDFLDVFNNRLIALLFRARKKFRPGLQSRPPQESRIARPFFALMGLGTPRIRGLMGVRERGLLAYAGIVGRAARGPVGLERMLEHYFAVPVRIAPFRPRWLRLGRGQWTVLGRNGRNRRLGRDTVLGTRVWDQGAGFELRIGALTLDEFLSFLPAGARHRPLRALVEFFTGKELAYTIRLVVRADQVPPLRLGGAPGPRLGWTAWLKTRATRGEDSQVALAIDP
jgi:type VI secretion system protein ImpH